MSVTQELAASAPPHELIGRTDGPIVVVLGGISADRHVCSHARNARPGWWEPIAGPRRALDTSTFRLLGIDYLDGGEGDDRRPERIVTTHDQAEALAAVLDRLGIERVHAVIGASYGGMVALAFAERYPARLEHLVVIGAAHESHPMITAVRSIQRRIVELGIGTDRIGEALVLARSLGITTYRSPREFAFRFPTAPESTTSNDAVFPVERHVRDEAAHFTARFRAARFLALSLSSDLHSVDPTRIRAASTLVAIEDDTVAPPWQIHALALVLGLGARTRFVELPSHQGHDAFLTDADALAPILRAALS